MLDPRRQQREVLPRPPRLAGIAFEETPTVEHFDGRLAPDECLPVRCKIQIWATLISTFTLTLCARLRG